MIGGDNIEGLLVSPKQLAFKHLEVRALYVCFCLVLLVDILNA